MVIAGLMAPGKTVVQNIEYIDRGYENLVGKFENLGGTIRRISE
jgi:UDP-N-acetylglucosamine 1-carboxyvinyltransferase